MFREQGDALLPFCFSFALEHNIKMIHENQKGMKLNGTQSMLIMLIYWTRT
jgi:hypothetical protein